MAEEGQGLGLGSFAGVGLNKALVEFEPYLGVVIADEITPSEFAKGGLQWHFGVRPVRYNLAGTTGYWQDWAAPSERLNSKMGRILDGLKKSLAPSVVKEIGQIGTGSLVGQVAWFTKATYKFGKDDQGNTIEVTMNCIGHHKATEEERAEAAALGPIAAAPQATPGPAASTFEWTKDTVNAAVDLLHGRTQLEALRAAVELGPDQAELRGLITSGAAAEYLLANGYLVGTDDGHYQRI